MAFDTRTSVTSKGLRGVWGEVSSQNCNVAGGAVCPMGSSCGFIAGGSTSGRGCFTPDGLILARERLTPGADGVQPLVAPDFNEWIMMRHAYCATLRQDKSYAPTAYQDDAVSCTVMPPYVP
jgi:hypothetical protein